MPLPLSKVPPARANEIGDEALIAAIATGDSEALGRLYDRYGRDVYAFLHRSGRDHRDHLDDLVQETFLSALHASRGFRGHSHARTWLFGIATNVARNHRRKEARKTRSLELVATSTSQP
jgi:RNA polymerase sigma-70 factor (ECF subfamily)